jgi:hypothetical protein
MHTCEGGVVVAALRAENNRLKRAAADAAKAARKAEADKAKASGDHEKRAEEAERRAEEAEQKLTRAERTSRVTAAAQRLGFKYPADAHRFLEPEEMDDDASVEAALKALKREKGDLFATTRRSGGAIDGPDAGGSRNSMDDLIRGIAR